MARQTQDREDLLRDATAYQLRIEFLIEVGEERVSVFAGFRENGGLSLYFGPDPVYQFNSQKKLRRAFVDDFIYKAENGQLVRLNRNRSEQNVELQRHVLTPTEIAAFEENLMQRLTPLRVALEDGNTEVVGQHPDNTDVLKKLWKWLSEHVLLTISDSPRAT